MPPSDGHSIKLTVDVDVDAPAAIVWNALVHDEHRHRSWSYLGLDGRPGGRLLERWHDAQGRERTTSVKSWRFDHLSCSAAPWRDDDWPAATEVEFALQADGDASLLRLPSLRLGTAPRARPRAATSARAGLACTSTT